MDLTNSEIELWNRLDRSYRDYLTASTLFFSQEVNRIGIIRYGLKRGDRPLALRLMEAMREAERLELFDELISLASYQIPEILAVREIIKTLPRTWVVDNIERAAEPYLFGDWAEEGYRRLLELYSELDDELALRFAHRAAAHPDADIAELGREYIEEDSIESDGDE